MCDACCLLAVYPACRVLAWLVVQLGRDLTLSRHFTRRSLHAREADQLPARTSSSSAAHRRLRHSDRSLTPYIFATSRALSLPSVICRRAVVKSWGVILRRLPPVRPSARAAFKPAM